MRKFSPSRLLLSALFVLPLCLSGAFAEKSEPFEKGADVPRLLQSLHKNADRHPLEAAAGEPNGGWTRNCAAVPASGETVRLASTFRPTACRGKDCSGIKNSRTVALRGKKARTTRACLKGTRFTAEPIRPTPRHRVKAGVETKLTVCRLRTIEGDDCVYTCSDGSSYRRPAAEPDPFDPDRPVIACPQIIIPF